MRINNSRNKIIILVFGLLLKGCASITSPGGGPRDKIPPQPVLSNPEHQQLNFKEQRIEITFDEFIELNNPHKEIIITPKLKEKVVIDFKGKMLYININEELQENTTYTINFREAVRDITERNPAKNLKLAFSTGNYIDTAYIKGTVKNILTEKPSNGCLIGLYSANDTLSIINQPPVYLTYADKEGNFQIDNLAKGRYRIYALNDANNNAIVDFKSESYGFLSSILELDTGLTDINIPVLYNNKNPMKLQSARPNGKYFLAKFNKYVDTYKIHSDSTIFTTIEEKNTAIKFYNNFFNKTDSLNIIIETVDTTGIVDTFSTVLKFSESPRQYDKYSFTTEIKNIVDKNYLLNANVLFNKPSFILDKDSIFLQIDSTTIVPLDSMVYQWQQNNTKFNIQYNFAKHVHDSLDVKAINLSLNNQAFISIDHDTTIYQSKKINLVTKETTGTIEIEVKTTHPSFIVQLLDLSFKLLDQQSNKPSFSFNNVLPGSYIIRLLIDSNNNGRWDQGNILENIEPEPVIIYKNTEDQASQTLKANWILGPLIFEY